MTITTTPLFPARGKITAISGDVVTFAPSNTTYELHLVCPGYAGPLDTLVDGVIRVQARKAYTVPSGGNFITPLYGPPKIIQGRVRAVEGNSIILQANSSATIYAALPDESSAVELANGSITAGSMVNVVAFPGATLELVR